ncbi:MAG: helix-turn-helix domain-containing protein [Myxococcaceae bacterium]
MGVVERKLGRRIADHRKLAKLTQAELAEKVGVATETISRLERGAAIPSLARLESVAAALGVELHDLFRFRDQSTSKDRLIDQLVSLVRTRSAGDIEVVRDVAARVLSHWK